ncbi:MAG: ribbon-helix-helix protein, CopG family [Nitrospinae bacterium]|nr:ribbon-helix-helix protein, CopG family [Nitrospinota bacterium]
MERRNITLSLPKDLLKKAKIMAAKFDKSISQLMREAIEEKIEEGIDYQRAKQKHLNILKKGIDMGTRGRILISREELHDRR